VGLWHQPLISLIGISIEALWAPPGEAAAIFRDICSRNRGTGCRRIIGRKGPLRVDLTRSPKGIRTAVM
jgi:hypothetical protein